jgi:hypothetical protein
VILRWSRSVAPVPLRQTKAPLPERGRSRPDSTIPLSEETSRASPTPSLICVTTGTEPRRRHGEPARGAGVAPSVRRSRPAQLVHARARRDRARRRDRPRGSRAAARLVYRAHGRDSVEHASTCVLRGHRNVDLPDAAVHLHDARLRDERVGAVGRRRTPLAGCASSGRAISPPTAPNRRCTSTTTVCWSATATTSRSAAVRARRTTSPTTPKSRASASPRSTGSSRAPLTASRSPSPSSPRSISATSRLQPENDRHRHRSGRGDHSRVRTIDLMSSHSAM